MSTGQATKAVLRPSTEELLSFGCRLCGLPYHRGIFGFEFTGLQYCLILRAIFPKNIDFRRMCWAPTAIKSQLDGNIEYFLSSCRALEGPTDELPLRLSVEALQPAPRNIPVHLSILLWLHKQANIFGTAPDHHPLDILQQQIPMCTAELALPASSAALLHQLDLSRGAIASAKAELARMLVAREGVDLARIADVLEGPQSQLDQLSRLRQLPTAADVRLG